MSEHLDILAIDDSSDDLFLMRKAFEKANIANTVQFVRNGEEAIAYMDGKEQFKDRSLYPYPGIIFCDIKMPRLEGFELLRWLRHHPDHARTPLIIFSSSNQDSDIAKAYNLGATAYLVKPNSLDELQEMMTDAFRFWSRCKKPIPG